MKENQNNHPFHLPEEAVRRLLLLHRMSINGGCDAEKITSLVQSHAPKAELFRQHEAELTFTLPFESVNTFPGRVDMAT